MNRAVFFEDIRLGQQSRSEAYHVTEAEMLAFAKQYDPQPMHLDKVLATSGFFGGLVASGWLSLSLTMRLLVQSRPLGRTELVGVAVDEIRFLRPLHAGEQLWIQAEVIQRYPVASRPDQGLIKLKVATFVAEKSPLLSLTVTLLVPKRLS